MGRAAHPPGGAASIGVRRAPIQGGKSVLQSVFERAAFWIERVLAFAFMAAVGLNFVNVIGRYVFGASILSADELQIYTMVMMTFLGAAVVTWRQQHLRMDVLIDACPAPVRVVVRVAELVLLAVICGFVGYQSYAYADRMFLIGRTSDTAGVPMWIPHGVVALGFGSMALIAIWRIAVVLRHRTTAPLEIKRKPGEGVAA
jgi:TRAP-type C4-dicarboxylate transport system permease small subunit